MNKLFIDDLIDRFGCELETILCGDQNMVKSKLIEFGDCDRFPMICYEHTNDSNFEVDLSETKFLNDPIHAGTWIMGINDDEIVFILNLKNRNNISFEIDVFEVRDELRGSGIGSNLIAVVESVAEEYYKCIVVSPFDTDAQNFWEKMEYETMHTGNLIKRLTYGES